MHKIHKIPKRKTLKYLSFDHLESVFTFCAFCAFCGYSDLLTTEPGSGPRRVMIRRKPHDLYGCVKCRERRSKSRSTDLAGWLLSIEGNQVTLFDRINGIFPDLQGFFCTLWIPWVLSHHSSWIFRLSCWWGTSIMRPCKSWAILSILSFLKRRQMVTNAGNTGAIPGPPTWLTSGWASGVIRLLFAY